ncbi:phosphatidate cytidylyltransferase [Candidatus Symbiothrix dinenymphae]|nr:phosphatidate cytidylyltransferase [Candidatus Symbiothrix dinenymphae]
MLTRSITGLIYVLVILGGIMGGACTFGALFAVVTVCCLWEFYGLLNVHKSASINRLHHCLGGLILFASFYSYQFAVTSYQLPVTSLQLPVTGYQLLIFLPYLLYLVSVLVAELYVENEDHIAHLGYIFLGQIYIALPFSLLNIVAFTQEGYTPIFLLALFVFIWVNDTGAYLTGMKFGKHRLIERISPKKTWEGFWGGLTFAALSSLAFAQTTTASVTGHWSLVTGNWQLVTAIWLAMALAVALFGVWGDLIESLFKRTLGIKDSGNALPGHGGFLDRFDSLLLAVYALVFFTCC